MTMLTPILTGCPISPTPSRPRLTRLLEDRTSRRPAMGRSRAVSPAPPAARFMSFFPIARRNTSQDATWPSAKRPDAGILPGGDGLASPARVGANLLETATRLRQGRRTTGIEVARKVQRGRARQLGRAGVRQWTRAPLLGQGEDLSGPVGQRPIPIHLSAGTGHVVIAAAHA